MIIGKQEFNMNTGHTYIMGILNVTPDSFSDGGRFLDKDASLAQAEKMLEEGADIIDVGGESTRPGYTKISVEEEIERVCRVVELIRSRLDIPISVDTYKSEVAKASLEAGADLINDIWGLRYDDRMAEVIARYKAPVVIMHNDHMGRTLEERGAIIEKYAGLSENRKASSMYSSGESYADASKQTTERFIISRYAKEEEVALRVVEGLTDSIGIALDAGISWDKIIVDPGVGFAKTQRENLTVLNNLALIRERTGMPMLLGASRKSVIGNALGLPVEEREEGTITTSIVAAMAGCSMVRVHNVKANRRALDMYEAIKM